MKATVSVNWLCTSLSNNLSVNFTVILQWNSGTLTTQKLDALIHSATESVNSILWHILKFDLTCNKKLTKVWKKSKQGSFFYMKNKKKL